MNIAEIWFYLRKNKLAVTGLVIILVLIIGAVFAPLITPTGYAEQKYLEKINDFPSVHHWFGVDALGRDYYSRVIYGIRISLLVGLVQHFSFGDGVPWEHWQVTGRNSRL